MTIRRLRRRCRIACPLRSHPKAPHLRLVVSREKTATLHCEMDEDMMRLIKALDIDIARPSLVRNS